MPRPPSSRATRASRDDGPQLVEGCVRAARLEADAEFVFPLNHLGRQRIFRRDEALYGIALALLAHQPLAVDEDREILVYVFTPIEHAEGARSGADRHRCFDEMARAPPGVAHS